MNPLSRLCWLCGWSVDCERTAPLPNRPYPPSPHPARPGPSFFRRACNALDAMWSDRARRDGEREGGCGGGAGGGDAIGGPGPYLLVASPRQRTHSVQLDRAQCGMCRPVQLWATRPWSTDSSRGSSWCHSVHEASDVSFGRSMSTRAAGASHSTSRASCGADARHGPLPA
eukprot:360535-Prymnesium_polylepis.1